MAHPPLEDLRFVLSKRTLSDDVALDYILADIPFLAVGILAFCTFTFLALTKRLGIMLTTLHLSIITAFIASTLDLSQILQRGRLNTELGLRLDSVRSLIKAREIGYALSSSLRFIFFWIFVAEPPRAERDTPNARAGTHSGNWNAWGLVGLILQWSTLCLTLSVFALQVAWRLSKPDALTNTYSAESAIEVILSAIFLLKLLLNCAHCQVASKWTCMLDYLGFIVPLLFSMGFGVANVMHLRFTETILGRFLQGVNFYILVLCSLLTVFIPPWKPNSGRVPPFRPLSPKQPASSFNVAPPDVSTPNLSAVQPRSDSPIIQQPQIYRLSSTAKMSGWLATQRKRLSSFSHQEDSQDDMNVRLWNQSRAERGASFWENPSKDSYVLDKVYEYPDLYLGTDPFQPPSIKKPKLEAPRLGRGFNKSPTSRYSNLNLSPSDVVGRTSWQADSPVFGLNGIIRASAGESGAHSQGSMTVADPDRSPDISDLFRKQEELDNSIAVLRLLEDPTDLPGSPSSSKQSGEPSTTRSEFSLSNFPNPPWVDSPESDNGSESRQSPSPARTTQRLRVNPPSTNTDNVSFDLVPPRIPISVVEHNRTFSLPVSEIAESDLLVSARTPRFDSQGTQYDVTSFIGNLTSEPLTDTPPPRHKKDFSGSSNNTGDLTITSSWSDDPGPTTTIVTLQQSKQTHVGSPLARMPVIISTTPGMLPATRVMIPPRPGLNISQPQPAVTRLRQDVSSDTFERPQVAPSMYR
ncbi:hypothetical protein BDM02DRAFT_2241153 [Thelephora ganbajun]|uniref:Uncharacterized protein n=1 Tax=Thelephora ganbajun TaxID=370292 RepID=A0ACB6ZGL7_THEGA|nr:hypothetical protein BDM02DRAFT_2241153 [Thelephora ganbajun]